MNLRIIGIRMVLAGERDDVGQQIILLLSGMPDDGVLAETGFSDFRFFI